MPSTDLASPPAADAGRRRQEAPWTLNVKPTEAAPLESSSSKRCCFAKPLSRDAWTYRGGDYRAKTRQAKPSSCWFRTSPATHTTLSLVLVHVLCMHHVSIYVTSSNLWHTTPAQHGTSLSSLCRLHRVLLVRSSLNCDPRIATITRRRAAQSRRGLWPGRRKKRLLARRGLRERASTGCRWGSLCPR